METTPKRLNARAEALIRHLGLDPKCAIRLKLTSVNGFPPEIQNCVINCMIQKKLHGGEIMFGWIIWQDMLEDFTEAEFHCVWKSPEKRWFDITPRENIEKEILFIPDPRRKAILDRSVSPPVTHIFDNVRMKGFHTDGPVQEKDIPFTKDSLLSYLDN